MRYGLSSVICGLLSIPYFCKKIENGIGKIDYRSME